MRHLSVAATVLAFVAACSGPGPTGPAVAAPPPTKTAYSGVWAHLFVRGRDQGSFVVDSSGNFSAASVTGGHMSDSGFTGLIVIQPSSHFFGGCSNHRYCLAPIRGVTEISASR